MALSGIYPHLQGARLEEAGTTEDFAPGTCTGDNQGGNWIYAQASEAIAIYDLCDISTALVNQAKPTTDLDVDAKVPMLGIPQVAVASGEYAWFWRGPGGGVGRGIKVNAALNCAKDVLLGVTDTDGIVDDDVVTDDMIAGLTLVATINTAAAEGSVATTILAWNLNEGIT